MFSYIISCRDLNMHINSNSNSNSKFFSIATLTLTTQWPELALHCWQLVGKTNVYRTVWQAESSFNTSCPYRQFELLISQLFADINDALSISTTRIIDINNWLLISAVRIVVIDNANRWYQQFKLLRSYIIDIDIPLAWQSSFNTNCRYH